MIVHPTPLHLTWSFFPCMYCPRLTKKIVMVSSFHVYPFCFNQSIVVSLNATGLVDRDPDTWFKMRLAKEKYVTFIFLFCIFNFLTIFNRVLEREANADALQTMRDQMSCIHCLLVFIINFLLLI